jgi:hypothetical protein
MSALFAALQPHVDRYVRAELYRQPVARAFLLSAYADAESGGESQVFARALRRAADPQVARLIQRHEEDELRHAALFDARRAALGQPAFPIPAALRTIDRLSDRAGGVLELPMDRDEDVAQAYRLLLVIEERALAEFSLAREAALAAGDVESAQLFAQISQDEERHLAYCRAVGRRFAGSDRAFEEGLPALRALEAQVHLEQSHRFIEHMVDRGLLHLSGLRGLLMRAIFSLARRQVSAQPAPGLAAA